MLYLVLVILDIVVCVIVLSKWKTFSHKSQKILMSFIIIFFTALIGMAAGVSDMKKMMSVEFCSQCHEMKYFRQSLDAEDSEVLSAVHWQNNYVPKDTACFACHTDYSMFGEVRAKMGGVKHMLVHYFGNSKEKPKLYKPYFLGNCLHCHETAKKFRKSKSHNKGDLPLEDVIAGKKGCLANGCHDTAHYVADTEDEDVKKEAKK